MVKDLKIELKCIEWRRVWDACGCSMLFDETPSRRTSWQHSTRIYSPSSHSFASSFSFCCQNSGCHRLRRCHGLIAFDFLYFYFLQLDLFGIALGVVWVCVLRVHAYERKVQNTKDDDKPILYIFHIRGDCNQRRSAAARRRGRRCLRQMPPNISLLFCCIQQSTTHTASTRAKPFISAQCLCTRRETHSIILCGNRRIDMHRPNGMEDRERNGRWDRKIEREIANSTEHCLWCVAWPMSSNCRKTFIARTV